MHGLGTLKGVGWDRKNKFRAHGQFYDALDTSMSQDTVAYALLHSKPLTLNPKPYIP